MTLTCCSTSRRSPARSIAAKSDTEYEVEKITKFGVAVPKEKKPEGAAKPAGEKKPEAAKKPEEKKQ